MDGHPALRGTRGTITRMTGPTYQPGTRVRWDHDGATYRVVYDYGRLVAIGDGTSHPIEVPRGELAVTGHQCSCQVTHRPDGSILDNRCTGRALDLGYHTGCPCPDCTTTQNA